MTYTHLTDDEIIHLADSQATTELERELARRFGALIDAASKDDSVHRKCEEYGVDVDDIADLIEVASEFNCARPAVLREKLERADAFWVLAQDLSKGDALARLVKLVADTH